MKISSYKPKYIKSDTILAADEDDPFADMEFDEPEADDGGDAEAGGFEDEEDHTLDEIDEGLEDIQEDSVDIQTDNNITDHFIAECDKCHNIFITSVISSDEVIEKISGICPLCDEESDQYLKWVIKDVEEIEHEPIVLD